MTRDQGKMPDHLADFRHIADTLRRAQRVAIEVENAPDKRKRLRGFTPSEAAALLGVPEAEFGTVRRRGNGRFTTRTILSFADLAAARNELHRRTGNWRFAPRRDAQAGEGLATVVCANFKGGVGKTTTAVHFAQHMALAGYRVLLVDLDWQGSATALFGIDPSLEVGKGNSFAGWFDHDGQARSLAIPTYWSAIDILAAGPVLQEVELALAQQAADRESAMSGSLYFDELSAYLASVADAYDVAVVDTRPDVSMLLLNALHAATGIVIPTKAEMVDLASTGEFFDFLAGYIEEMRGILGEGALSFAFAKVLATRYRPAERSQTTLLEMLRQRFGKAVLPHPMLDSAVLGTAGVGKETLYEYDPSTDRKAYERALAAVTAVNRAIEAEVLRAWGRPVAAGEGEAL